MTLDLMFETELVGNEVVLKTTESGVVVRSNPSIQLTGLCISNTMMMIQMNVCHGET